MDFYPLGLRPRGREAYALVMKHHDWSCLDSDMLVVKRWHCSECETVAFSTEEPTYKPSDTGRILIRLKDEWAFSGCIRADCDEEKLRLIHDT